MNFILFLVCTALVIAAGRATLRATSIRPELVLISLVSLYLAYPVKNLALAYLKNDFMTFDFFGAASPMIDVHFIIFIGITLLVLSRLAPARTVTEMASLPSPTRDFAVLALILLAANSLLLFWSVYQVTEGQLTALLFTSDARKAFLLNQQGQGWLSLLIFFAFPLIVLQARRTIRNPIVLVCILATFLALAAIGSRLFLFGYVICLITHFYRITPLIAAIMFFAFVLFGALIYMGFAGSGSVNSAYYGLIYFMRTFDGADLMNGYYETGRQIYYGITLVEEAFITYIPRILWDNKPFNFGGIVITGDIYPELQDVQSLRATFPPGLFLEGFANFWWLCPIFYYVVIKSLVELSRKKFHSNIYIYALYVSSAATAATIFRGLGSFIVSLTAFSMVLVAVFLFALPIRGARMATSAFRKSA